MCAGETILTIQTLRGVCDTPYYREAMEYFLKQDRDMTFVVFSDDIHNR